MSLPFVTKQLNLASHSYWSPSYRDDHAVWGGPCAQDRMQLAKSRRWSCIHAVTYELLVFSQGPAPKIASQSPTAGVYLSPKRTLRWIHELAVFLVGLEEICCWTFWSLVASWVDYCRQCRHFRRDWPIHHCLKWISYQAWSYNDWRGHYLDFKANRRQNLKPGYSKYLSFKK